MTTSAPTTHATPPVEYEPADDKINITANLCKKLVALVKDPTRGQTLEAPLRNKLRDTYADDLLTAIDVLALIASTEESFHDVLAISKKLDLPQMPTF